MSAKKTVAIVEDNEDNMLLTRTLLNGRYELQEYVDGISAEQGILSDPPDLVLMDISLPGQDGVAVLRAIRAVPRVAALPVIALTAHAMRGDRERFLAAGFDYYIAKPLVAAEQLIDAIEKFTRAEA